LLYFGISTLGINNACWAGDGLLATCAGEQNVRFWDLSHNSNYLLSLSMHNIGAASGTRKISKADRIITIDYNPRKRVLAAGTRDGNVVMWKNLAVAPSATKDDVSTKAKSASPSQKRKTSSAFNVVSQSRAVRPPSTKDSWKTLPVVGMNGRIKSLQWGAGEQLLAAETADNVTILSETVLHRKMFGPVAAIQVSSDQISIQRTASSNAEPMILRTGIRIKGMDLHGTSLIVWNGRKCEVYSIPKDQSGDSDAEPTRQGSFPTKSKACAVHNDNIFCAVGSRVEVCNFQGTVKTALSFTEAEGQPLHIDSNLKYLAVVTTTGVLKMFDISRREPRQLGSAGKFVDSKTGDDIGVVRSVRCNSDGTCMSLLADRKAGAYLRTPDERIHVSSFILSIKTKTKLTFTCL
jgi:intraflagellar transport protein 140